MAGLTPGLQRALSGLREYDTTRNHLSALLLSYPPPFIFIHDPENARLTTSVIHSTLTNLAAEPQNDLHIQYACLDAISCFSPRVIFDTALNALAGWTPDWQNGAANWQNQTGTESRRFNENFDAFVHGIQAIHADTSSPASKLNGIGKGKGKAKEPTSRRLRMVLVIERAERLKDNLPELLVPLTKLAELVSLKFRSLTNMLQSAQPSLNWTSPLCSYPKCNGKIYVHPSEHRPSRTISTYLSCQKKVRHKYMGSSTH